MTKKNILASVTTGGLAIAAFALPAFARPAAAQLSDNTVKIGIMTDMSGNYSDVGGKGSVEAARMAIADFGGAVKGMPIELVSADHQNKPDIASNIARQWYDIDKVDMITDLMASSTALAVQEIAREKNRIAIFNGSGSSDLTGKACSPNGVHWAYDTYALAKGTGVAGVQTGADSWFFITADYAFGYALERDTANFVTAAGGKVLGQVRHPFPSTDFSSFLLQAQASGAKMIGLANSGQDTVQAVKQAREFGIAQGNQRLASLLLFITDIHSMGLQSAQGLVLTTGFYWDFNDDTRAFAKRFHERHKAMPSMVQAGVYSSILHYLKAVDAIGGDGGKAVVEQMKKTPVNDFFAKNGVVREDGRMVHDMYLAQVKKPAESKGPWDYYKILKVIPGNDAFRPLGEGGCPLVKG